MTSLDRKLWRELWGMRGQALAIALVIVSGVAIFVMYLGTLDSLLLSRDRYYQESRFAQVFASLKRAPESLAGRIRTIPGVDRVETRVVAAVNLRVEGFTDPIVGHLVSIPDGRLPELNRLHLRRGRLVEPGRDDEVVVGEAFANAHRLGPGDTLSVVVNGRFKRLIIVGIALSPEYIYQIAPGAIFPDFERYGILWMGRTPLASAYGMEGAFNDLALTLSPGAHPEEVIDRLDDLLGPYGGQGAYGRKDQLSHRFLSEELKQLQTMAAVFPFIFFGVAAFLLNVVISRLISLQREQIAVLKAFGYGNLAVGVHYIKLVLVIVLAGSAGGLAAGIWLARALAGIYMDFYRFPFLIYQLQPGVVIAAVLVSIIAALLGTLHAVRKAAVLPPAQAMRPEPPTLYRATLVERLGLQRFFSQPTRMILRHIERRPLKSLLSMVGIAFACGIMMIGYFQEDAIDYMVAVHYGMSQREDLAVTFVEPASRRALYSLTGLRGVTHAEGFRSVPARLRFQHRSYRTAIEGIEPGGDLQRVLDADLRPIRLPPEGIVLTDYLARTLGVRPGDRVTVEVLEGNRPVWQVPVAGLTRQYLGMSAYMRRDALNRLLREGDVVSGAYLAVDRRYQDEVYGRLQEMPRIMGTVVHELAIKSFYETFAETILFFTYISLLLGGTIAFGVIYNSARIALSERSRELASLRVLGFTHGEIAYILIGELAVLTLAAIPLGFLFGRGLCAYLVVKLQTDLYRVPLVLEPDAYAFAAAVVLASACVSGFLLWRKLATLDLVAVLKTKE